MITTEEATAQILQRAPDDWGTEQVNLDDSTGRVLAEPLMADRDFPPFDRITMDGIAISYAAFESGKREFPVLGLAAAGAPQIGVDGSAGCAEVMTGAILPKGTDTVIRYEDILQTDGKASIQATKVRQGQNIHWKGSDRKQEAPLRSIHTLIGPSEIGIAATIGKSELLVQKSPRVIIISTGDEIVPVEQVPKPHQIRTSNLPTLKSLLATWGIPSKTMHIPDQMDATVEQIKSALVQSDLVLLSGGVSKGKFDFVPEALRSAGVEAVFHRVQQRPGKPLWFGQQPGGTTVFGLPGNPVSSFLCCLRYVQPWLRKGLGLEPYTYAYAALAESIQFKPDLTYFLQVRTAFDTQGRIWAHPIPGGGSGDHANLSNVSGFLELPAERSDFAEGEVFPLLMFRSFT